MWGFEPSDSAILTKDFFLGKDIKDILIPGIGYGRNAKIFYDNGINVTGIEISKTAIDLARQNGIDAEIFHGSVNDMPFNNKLYDGIFCYGLIYLLNQEERKKFISDCFNQLKPEGYMIFTAVSKKAPMFGKGIKLGENWYETMKGVRIFFYDANSIEQEFGEYGLTDFFEIDEPHKNAENSPPINFLFINLLIEVEEMDLRQK
jgi:SAM-dependent methyltransferase